MRAGRLLAPFVLIAAGACSEGPQSGTEQAATIEQDGRIDCRVGADEQFHRFCRVERTKMGEETILTVRKPDGGFRRLVATRDGRGVVAADGAEPAEVSIVGENLIEVAIGGDAFRLPARIGLVAPAPQ